MEWAAREAELRGDSLRIVHVMQRWLYGASEEEPMSEVGRWAREDAGNMLNEAAALAKQEAPETEVSTELLTGDAREALIQATDEATILVVGGRGEGGFSGLLLGSVAHGVVGNTRCPVVVVQNALGETRGQIVVGVDGSPPSAAALDLAFSEAAMRQATMRAVFARPPRGTVIYGVRVDEDDDQEAARQQLNSTVAPSPSAIPPCG